MMTNSPKVLVELSPMEAAWLMDKLHEEWQRRVALTAVCGGPVAHVMAYHKHKAIDLMNRIDRNATNQGFGDL